MASTMDTQPVSSMRFAIDESLQIARMSDSWLTPDGSMII